MFLHWHMLFDGTRLCNCEHSRRYKELARRRNTMTGSEADGFQDRGGPYRRALGIDGTAGDAQDIPHPFIPTPGEHGCVVCGLRETYRQHHKPGIPTASEVEAKVKAGGAGNAARFDVWVEFNDIDTTGRTVTYADLAIRGVALAPGRALIAGDGEGDTCPATVVEADGERVVLQLDLDRFQAAP